MTGQPCGAFHPLTGELCARDRHADTIEHHAADGCHWPANTPFEPVGVMVRARRPTGEDPAA